MKSLLILLCGIAASLGLGMGQDLAAGNLRISSESRELILYYETGGCSYYNARLKRPTVPPAPSGVTIGIGYDCGFNSREQIAADWGPYLPASQIARLQSVAGLKGAWAKAALPRVRDIVVPWEVAVKVYESRTVPRFAKLTERAYPGVLALPSHMQGVMLSTSFNRGTDFVGDRRRELRWTRDDIAHGSTAKLPAYQLQMRRLWPTTLGLQRRYSAHAGLMQRAIDESSP
jgi:hypothetical protein